MSSRRFTVLTTVLALLLIALPAPALSHRTEVIVVLDPVDRPVHEVAEQVAAAHGGEIGFVYTTALQGFTLTLPEAAVAGLERNPRVAYIEPVREVQAFGTQPIPTGIDRIEGDANPPAQPLDVDIAILDTGVYIGQNPDGSGRSHLDLNLQWVSDCTGALFYPMFGGGCSGSGDFQDYHGHGTHVAGIAAALDNDIGSIGVAPGAVLWSFKVLDASGTGTTGMILAGIDGVASKADQIEVANMSLGFQGSSHRRSTTPSPTRPTPAFSSWWPPATTSSTPAGSAPPTRPDAVAVSAVADFDGLPGGLATATCRPDQDDTLADFSNYGDTVEIAAPGVCIYSTDLNDGYSVKSGTSMASPFVAGAFARYIAETGAPTNSRADVEAIKAAVIGSAAPQQSTCGFQDVADNSPEPMLFVNGPAFGGDGSCGGTPPPTGNTAPTASFSSTCSDLSCDFTNETFDPDLGDIVTYLWDFGDGNTSTEENPSHAYASAGTYSVSLTADDGTDTDAFSDDVTVTEPAPNQPPTADFSASCTDLDCTFTDLSSDPDGDPLSYLWDFGDGSSSTQASPSHSYATAGDYTVTVTVDDGEFSHSTALHSRSQATDPPVATLVGGVVNPLVSTTRDAEAAIAVYDELGDFVGNATVEGVFTYVDKRGREKTATASAVSEESDIGYSGFVANALVVKTLTTGEHGPQLLYHRHRGRRTNVRPHPRDTTATRGRASHSTTRPVTPAQYLRAMEFAKSKGVIGRP